MGKVRKPKTNRSKSLSKKDIKSKAPLPESSTTKLVPTVDAEEDPFLALKLNLDDLIDIPKKSVSDDAKSVLSYKSIRSNKAGNRIIKKKDKLNLKKKLLMKKIDVVQQMKKGLKVRDKRKQTAIIGDTNPLHDALPSLESLLKTRSNISYDTVEKTKKTKAIEKAKKRKNKLVDDINVFKKALNNKTFKRNPFEAISSHIQAVVEFEKRNVKK